MDGSSGISTLERLVAGNARFVSGVGVRTATTSDGSGRGPGVADLSVASPVAVILGCSDSRVPPELVFDQSVGDLFVIRVAGNVVGSHELGSIEYAVARWDCGLVVVLGHTECGAVAATLPMPPPGTETPPDLATSGHLASLLVTVRANVAAAVRSPGVVDPWRAGVEANVHETVRAVGSQSSLLCDRRASGRLAICGAVYDVHSGEVSFLGV